jgi:hypothetical protein
MNLGLEILISYMAVGAALLLLGGLFAWIAGRRERIPQLRAEPIPRAESLFAKERSEQWLQDLAQSKTLLHVEDHVRSCGCDDCLFSHHLARDLSTARANEWDHL